MRSDQFMKKKNKGTYAGVHFSESTKHAIASYIKENAIPNAPDTDSMHTTLLYSKKYCPTYKPQGEIFPAYIGTPTKFDVWKSQPDSDGNKTNCLVLEYDCPDLADRHKLLMQEHDLTFDYTDYKTHITFSYDVGDMDYTALPMFDGPIEIIEEYGEDLDLDWARNSTKK